jgi:hypothetical protein
MISGNAAN